MRAVWFRLRTALALTAALALMVTATVAEQPGGAPEAATPKLNRTLAGQWQVAYEDAALGKVQGVATVAKDEKSVEVKLRQPGVGISGTKYLKSTSFTREGDTIKVKLEGKSPFSPRVTAPAMKDLPRLGIDAGTPGGSAAIGADTYPVTIKPSGEADLDTVELTLTFNDRGDMEGEWSYKASPITERDRRGYGRVGTFTMLEEPEAIGEQRGKEVWRRRMATVLGATVINDQMARQSYGPVWPYPFSAPGAPAADMVRRLVVYGHDLPKSWGDEAELKAVTTGAEYVMVTPSDESQWKPEERERIYVGFRRAMAEAAQKHKTMDKDGVELMLVSARLMGSVKPGRQIFTLNGSQGDWLLQFGDGVGKISFVRMLSTGDDGAEKRGERRGTEELGVVYLHERVVMEVRTEGDIRTLDTIELRLAQNGAAPVYSGGETIACKRVRTGVYRSDPIYLQQAGKPAARSGQGMLVWTAAAGDKLSAKLVDGELLTIIAGGDMDLVSKDDDGTNPGTTVKVQNTPADGGTMWKEALRRAARCAGIEGKYDWDHISDKEAKEVANYFFAEYIFAGNVWVAKKLGMYQGADGATSVRRRTVISIGDHAAMLLLRDEFKRLMTAQMKNIQGLSDEKAARGFRDMLRAQTQSVKGNPLGRLEVKKAAKDNQFTFQFNIPYEYAVSDGYLERVFGKDKKAADDYSMAATRELIAQYQAAATKTLARASGDDCDIDELMDLTGKGFDAVAAAAQSRLMKLTEVPGDPPDYVWEPDYVARAAINNFGTVVEAIKAQKEYASTDTMVLVAAVSVAMPFLAAEGFVGACISFAVTAVMADAEVASALYDHYMSNREINTALGAHEVIGTDRLDEALLAKTEWYHTLARLVGAGLMVAGEGLNVVHMAELDAARAAAPGLLSRAKAARTAAEGFAALNEAERSKLALAISDAEQKLLTKGEKALTDAQRELIGYGSSLERDMRRIEYGRAAVLQAQREEEAVAHVPKPEPVHEPVVQSGEKPVVGGGPKPPERSPTPGITEHVGGVTPEEPKPPVHEPLVEPKPAPSEHAPTPPHEPTEVKPTPGGHEPSPPPREPTATPDRPAPGAPEAKPNPGGREPIAAPPEPQPAPKPRQGDIPTQPLPHEPAAKPNELPGPGTRANEPPAPGGALKPAEPHTPVLDKPDLPPSESQVISSDPRHGNPGVHPSDETAVLKSPDLPPTESTIVPTGKRPGTETLPLPGTETPPLPEVHGAGGVPHEPELPPGRKFDPNAPTPLDVPAAGPKPAAPGPLPAHPEPFDPTVPRMEPARPAAPPLRGVNQTEIPPGAQDVLGPPPATGEIDRNHIYTELPKGPDRHKGTIDELQQFDDTWKHRSFTYRDPAGRVYEIDGMIGEGGFNRAYKLGGENEGKVIKFRMKDDFGKWDLGLRQEGVVKSKELSDEINRIGLHDLRVYSAGADGNPPYIIMEQAGPNDKFFSENGLAYGFDGRKYKTVEDYDRALLAHVEKNGWTKAHQEAYVDFIDQMTAKGYRAEDFKIDNLCFNDEGGTVTVKVADHERFGIAGGEDMEGWEAMMHPREYDPSPAFKAAEQNFITQKDALLNLKTQIGELERTPARTAEQEQQLERLRSASKIIEERNLPLARRTMDAAYPNNIASYQTLQDRAVQRFDWSADERTWPSKMFEHNRYIRYDSVTGKFRPLLIDPAIIEKKFPIYRYLGPVRPRTLRLVEPPVWLGPDERWLMPAKAA